MKRGVIAFVVLIASASFALAQQPNPRPGAPRAAPSVQPAPEQAPVFQTTPATPPLLDYCAPPVKPACADSDATYRDAKTRNSCQQEMDRYVRYVFAWRVCVNAEVERIVRQTNEAIAKHKCRVAGGKRC